MTNISNINEKMSSRDIAILTEKPHSDLLKSIRKMEEAWIKVNGGNFSLVEYEDAKGEKRPMYNLSKTESLYIATKFNDEARAKVILRWEELENKQMELPSNFADALRMLADSTEREEQLQATNRKQMQVLAEVKPKVKYHDEVLSSNSAHTTSKIANELGISATKLNQKLHYLKVQYKQDKTWLLYAKYRGQGYTQSKTHTFIDGYGNTRTEIQTKWTEKGRQFIHELIKEQIAS